MIHSISFNNYKSFKSITKLDIKPITILVGPNSSGKSSITKLFGLLHQSFDDINKKELLSYIGDNVDLSSFKNISHRNKEGDIYIEIILDQYDLILNNSVDDLPNMRDTPAKLVFNIAKTNQEVEYEFLDYSINNNKQNGKIRIVRGSDNYEIKYDDLDLIQVKPEELENGNIIKYLLEGYGLTLDEAIDKLLHGNRKSIQNLIVENRGLSFRIISDYIQSNTSFNFPQWRVDEMVRDIKKVLFGNGSGDNRLDEVIRGLIEKIKDYPDFKDDNNDLDLDKIVKSYLSNFVYDYFNRKRDGFMRAVNNFMNPTIEGNIKGIAYHGPIRSKPKRSYDAYEIKKMLSTGWPIPKSFKEQLENEISQNLLYIGQKSRFTVDRIDADHCRMVIKNELSKSKHNLTDVGFGLSQIIPIFISIERSRCIDYPAPLIVIEQPELHLHPQAQAYMSNIFYNGLLFNGKRNRSKFVLETHSEHLIRGFQVLVAKNKLSPDDIAIYYIEKNKRGNSIVKNIPIDEKGFFTETWPEGFFDQAYRQSVELISGSH